MANETTPARDRDEEEGLHRLRDMVVEEVSLVDRAANKRRFLIVKRSDDMADDDKTELRPGDAGDGVEKAKKKPGADNGEEMDEQKRKKPAEAEDAEKARRRAAGDGDEDEAEKARDPKDEDDDEDETEKAKASDDEDEDDEGEDDEKKRSRKQDLALPTAVKEAALRLLTEALERLMNVANRVKEAAETANEASATLPADLLAEIGAIAQILGKLGAGNAPAAKAAVEKPGARMAKDRLDRFQKALALLAEILKELTDSKQAAPAPTAGAAEAGVRKRDAGVPPAPVPGLAELVAGIGELTRVVKRQEDELSRIRQARGVSNTIPVDGGRRAAPEEVSWPFDMNRPITRDKVKKEVSFFDDEAR
jgi:hypothetical protein